jgi:uncharacterized protein (TIGR03067 family)
MIRVFASLFVVVPFVLCTLGARADDTDKAVKEEMKKLEGTWVLKEFSLNGKETPKEKLGKIAGAEITIKGDAMTVDGRAKFKIVIDPSKKPKTIDRIREAFGQSFTREGLYQLEGDTLKICFDYEASKSGKPGRPKELKSGEGLIMSVYERKTK